MARKFIRLFVFVLVLQMTLPLCPAPSAVASVADQALAVKDVSDLLQFTSAEHVFGFKPGEYYLSNATYALRVQFVGANFVRPVSDEAMQLDGQKASPLNHVTYPNLWQDITLTYDATSGGLARSTYRLEPGAEVKAIHLRYNAPVTLNADGSLSLTYATGSIDETAPVAWQMLDGRRVPVDVQFVALSELEVGFALGTYDMSRPLTIDPTLTWNTFLGDRAPYDTGRSVAIDEYDNIYVTGYSEGTWGAPLRAYTGGDDAFVAKLDSNGVLLWNTFIGGVEEDYGVDIALDPSGNVYVIGWSNATWGDTPVRSYSAAMDAFVAQFDQGGALVWHTFLGAAGSDSGAGLEVDGTGDVYVTGSTSAIPGVGPTSWGAPVVGHSGGSDAFAAKLNASGLLIWNTFLGGISSDSGQQIAPDANGNVYVVGYSSATWGTPVRVYSSSIDTFAVQLGAANGVLAWSTFLGGSGSDNARDAAVGGEGAVYVVGYSSATWSTPLNAYVGASDVYVARLDPDGGLSWNTFLGSSTNDNGNAIAVDENDAVYVAGYSVATWGTPISAYTGGNDAFVAKLEAAGALAWSTFLGGAGNDSAYGVDVDSSGNVFTVGGSAAAWGAPVRAYSGGTDVLAVHLNTSGSLGWSTFLGGAGGSGTDKGNAVAVDGSGTIYVAGSSDSTWGTPVRAHAGSDDAFVAKIDAGGGLIWNTFLGGTGNDYASAIAADVSGSVYVVGYSRTAWGVPVRPFAGGYDTYVAKLDSGGALTWNSFVGGTGDDKGYGVAMDGNGNVYMSGSSNLPWGTPVRPFSGGLNDAFAASMDANGTLVWNTFLGGIGTDNGMAVAVDESGNAYLTGATCCGSDATWGMPVRPFYAQGEAFVAKLDTTGALTWNTFLGGSVWGIGQNYGRDIALNDDGSVLVIGDSDTPWGDPIRPFTGSSGPTDAFVARLDSSGALEWNTFLGGYSSDRGRAIAVNEGGSIFVAGDSGSFWGTPVGFGTNGTDAFTGALDVSGALIWHGFLGSGSTDSALGVAAGSGNRLVVVGYSAANWGSPVRAFSGGDYDAFVTQIGSQPLAVELARFDATVNVDRVQVAWETVSEVDTTGFKLYRSTSVDGPHDLLAFLPAQTPGGTQGASYVYDDQAVQTGQTYWYWLEDVDINNVATRHGPVSVTVAGPTAVSLTGFGAATATPAALPLVAVIAAMLGGLAVCRRRRC